VRELANPVHCECIIDGIVTRTSPQSRLVRPASSTLTWNRWRLRRRTNWRLCLV